LPTPWQHQQQTQHLWSGAGFQSNRNFQGSAASCQGSKQGQEMPRKTAAQLRNQRAAQDQVSSAATHVPQFAAVQPQLAPLMGAMPAAPTQAGAALPGIAMVMAPFGLCMPPALCTLGAAAAATMPGAAGTGLPLPLQPQLPLLPAAAALGGGGGSAAVPVLGPAPGCGRAAATATGGLSGAEILSAVESLYVDELKPYGRILRKRLAEQANAAGRGAADIGIRELRTACEACAWLDVQAEGGADWSAQIRGRPAVFVDVYSPQDHYPQELWYQVAAYFANLQGSEMVLPGGRYACAQMLVGRGAPFAARRSLGEVCHIVQLAISQKKLLGYLNGTIVPYARSQSMVKETCAARGRPCNSGARGKNFASWDMVRECLQEIIRDMNPSDEFIPLSNVKRFFRSRFHVELSETALGYAKLSELVQDPRLQDLCRVRLHGHGYVLVPVRPPAQRNLISLADVLPVGDVEHPPGCPAVSSHTEAAAAAAAAEPPRAALARRRPGWIEPLSMDVIETPPATPLVSSAAATAAAGAKMAESPHSEAVSAAAVSRTPLAARLAFPPTPSPCAARAATSAALAADAHLLPKLLGSRAAGGPLGSAASVAGAALKGQLQLAGSGKAVGTAAAGADQNTQVLRAGGELEAPPMWPPQSQQVIHPWQLAPLTPSTLDDMGFRVRNTFLHAPLPPPTPVKGVAGSGRTFARSHSVPKNLQRCGELYASAR